MGRAPVEARRATERGAIERGRRLPGPCAWYRPSAGAATAAPAAATSAAAAPAEDREPAGRTRRRRSAALAG